MSTHPPALCREDHRVPDLPQDLPDELLTQIHPERPHSARVWNYWLGGKDNYEADRTVADTAAAHNPDMPVIAREARRFLVRVVTHLAADAGVDQFLDIGTGLPTMDSTHEVAQQILPHARIAYVDNDPLVLAHARVLLRNTTPDGVTTYLHADVRDPERILTEAGTVLDLDRPVAVMLLGVLGHAAPHFEQMQSIITRLMDGVPPGSYLVLQDGSDTSAAVRAAAVINHYTLRTLDQFRQCFDGLIMVEPGLVPTPRWRPTITTSNSTAPTIDSYGAVARKP